MESQTTKTRQMLDRPMPEPPSGPSNVSSGVKKDLPCSSPGCPNFCNVKCGFCETHCGKFHDGVHYNEKGLKADVPDAVRVFLDLESGDTIEWAKDFDSQGNRIVKINKKK